MKAPIKKNFLSGYNAGFKIVSGFLIATTVIVGGFFFYRAKTVSPKPTPVKSVSPSTSKSNTVIKNNFDGRYSGSSNVASGISSASVNVSGSILSGDASYSAPDGSKIPLRVTGSVQRGDSSSGRKDGNIQCSFSGSGFVLGQKVSVSGSCMGHIITTSMNISYSATASGAGQSQTYPGQITLSKK